MADVSNSLSNNKVLSIDKSKEPLTRHSRTYVHDQVSYGTLTPYFMIDTEYLKSIIEGKGSNCELVESASLKNTPGLFFPSTLRQNLRDKERSSSFESGVVSNQRGITVESPTINASYVPNFFTNCEQQVTKLFSFMDFHVSKVESDVEVVRRTNRGENENDPSFVVDENDDENLSDDSGVCENETKHLLTTEDDEDQIQSSVGVLTRLREVLVSLQESLSSSFAALDELVDMRDNHHDNSQGRKYLESKLPRRNEYEKRLGACMENIDHELNMLYRKQDLKIDGHGRVRIRTESQITVKVRETSINCFTYLHVILFMVTAGLITYMYLGDGNSTKWTVYLRLLRGPLLILLFLYLFGLNMKGWAVKHIDYVNIFEYPPNGTPTPRYVFKVAGLFCVFFSMMVVILLITTPFTDEVPGKVVPLIMWFSLILFLVNPFRMLLRRGRLSLVLVFVRILLAPFTFVYFGDFWLADQLNSTVAILLDMQYFLCYMIADTWYGEADAKVCTSSGNGIRPVISCLPAMWRLLQCLRCFYDTKKVKHLLNAGKYMTTFPVVVLATMFATKVSDTFSIYKLDLGDVGWIIILWFIFSFVHAFYTFIWDIYCDWGLWDFARGTYFRKTLVYRYKIIYLFAIVLDLLLRFAWALKLTLAIVWHLDSDLIYTGE